MYKNKKQYTPKDNFKIADPKPAQCMNSGCTNETQIAFMQVWNKYASRVEIGSVGASKGKMSYGYANKDQIVMNDGFDFRSWITRCGYCYQDDLKAQGKRAVDLCRGHAENMEKHKKEISN